MDELPIIDQAQVNGIVEVGGPELLRDLLVIMRSNCERRLTEAQAAAAAQRRPDLERAVHALRSSAANLGAVRVAALARELEYGAANQTPEQWAAGVAALAHAVTEAQAELERLAAVPTAPPSPAASRPDAPAPGAPATPRPPQP